MDFTFNLIGTALTIFFGFWALFQPKKFSKILALQPHSKRGITEIRSTYGGWMLGLSIFTAIQQQEILFMCLGYGWLVTGIVRTVAMMLLDDSYSKHNLQFVIVEIIIAICLLI